MKQADEVLEVIVCRELDVRKLPKDMFDAFIAAVVDNIIKSMREDGAKNKE